MKTFDIAIAGEINLDLILYGLPVEMPVERELLASAFHATLGSSSAIVAHNAAMLGARVAFTSLVGPDDFGKIALDRLRSAGVEVSHVSAHPTLSTGITVLLPHGSERHILTYPGTMTELTCSRLDMGFLEQARHLHLSSLFLQQGLHPGLPSLLAQLKQAGLTISLDTNDDPDDRWGAPLWELLPFVDVFMPNESELCRMTHCTDVEAAIAVFENKVPLLVVKRGARGARLRAAGRSIDVAPLQVTPIDTIGAGDSFDAGFLRAYLMGKDPVVSATCGNIAAALSTQGVGGTEAFRDTQQREAFLKRHKFFERIARSELE